MKYSRHLQTEARTRKVFVKHFEWTTSNPNPPTLNVVPLETNLNEMSIERKNMNQSNGFKTEY